MSATRIHPGRRPRLEPRTELPHAVDPPRRAFLAGWWGGIWVGMAIGAGISVLLLKA